MFVSILQELERWENLNINTRPNEHITYRRWCGEDGSWGDGTSLIISKEKGDIRKLSNHISFNMFAASRGFRT